MAFSQVQLIYILAETKNYGLCKGNTAGGYSIIEDKLSCLAALSSHEKLNRGNLDCLLDRPTPLLASLFPSAKTDKHRSSSQCPCESDKTKNDRRQWGSNTWRAMGGGFWRRLYCFCKSTPAACTLYDTQITSGKGKIESFQKREENWTQNFVWRGGREGKKRRKKKPARCQQQRN